MVPQITGKIENAIYFFASEHKKKTRKDLYQLFLYKYLAFFDFRSLEETGEPALNLTYKAMEMGPVPAEIYIDHKYRDCDLYFFTGDDFGTKIDLKKSAKPDYDYFSPYELALLNNLIEIFADIYVTSDMMSEASHQEIMAWRRTRKDNPNGIINYINDFAGNILNKPLEKLTLPEEHFLIYSALNQQTK